VRNNEIADAARALDGIVPIVKAYLVERSSPASNAVQPEDPDANRFAQQGVIEPIHDPETLCALFEHSGALRSNVDGYATNIDSFGYRLEAIIDLEADDADKKIADAIYVERLRTADATAPPPTEPTPEEILAKKEELRRAMRLEKVRIDLFFESCCADTSFVQHRMCTRTDYEVTGNAYWELIRDQGGRLAQLVFVPSHSIRLTTSDVQPTEVSATYRVGALGYETRSYKRRFRRFVQRVGTDTVWFKQWGDPRVVSRMTGRVFPTLAAFNAEKEDRDGPATEILHFRLYSPRSAYGVPRWIGVLISVLGSRASEEVNYLYFDNKGIPPLAILVSGGHLASDGKLRLRDYLENNFKGREAFHNVLILEADSAGNPNADASRVRIAIQPLTGAQLKDGLFQQYDERNIDKIGQSFRLPRLLRGDVRDFNRATADASIQFAEMQVFQPEREAFDHQVNWLITRELGVRHWRFASSAPITRDPDVLSQMIQRLVVAGVLTPEDGRELSVDVFNKPFKRIDEEWVRQPIALTVAGLGASPGLNASGAGAEPPPPTLEQRAEELLSLRAALQRAAEQGFDGEREKVLRVPSSEFASWFDQEPAPSTPTAP
jgi:PBSX family phage portal protein